MWDGKTVQQWRTEIGPPIHAVGDRVKCRDRSVIGMVGIIESVHVPGVIHPTRIYRVRIGAHRRYGGFLTFAEDELAATDQPVSWGEDVG